MASFIAIPLKKTSEIDLVKPLKYVFSSFCVTADEPVNYDDALNELNKLRMNSTWRTLDKHENSLDTMTKYYDQLNYLDMKCPAVEFQIPFKWKDAFDKGSFFLGSASLTLSTLSFEKICILFNIGAMQSQVACSHITDTRNDEGLKSAIKYFQLASGTFQYLKSIAVSPALEEPTPDLRQDTLSALQVMMLAQAQESFFYKTVDAMPEAAIAKVAAWTEELYADALKLMQKESVHHLWEKDWIPLVSGKQAGFCALAEYYQSLVCNAKKEVGEEIARLQKALDVIKAAESKGVLHPDFKDYIAKMNHNYDVAKRDNDFIYHERIPDSKSLTAIGKAALAKPLLPGEKLNPNSQDLFTALLPVAVQQAMSAFDVCKMEIVNGEKAKMQSDTQVLDGILASLNLPAALEDAAGMGLPQSLLEKAQAIHNKGGLDTIQKFINNLPDLMQRNSEILDDIERMLQDEEESDAQLRAKFGNQWIRTPSSKLNEPLKVNLRKYQSIVATAKDADAVVKEKFEKHREKIALLCMPHDQLLSGIPEARATGSSAAKEKLKALVSQTNHIKREREALMGELESAAIDMKAKFLAALSADGAVNEHALSVETLGEIYGPIQKRIRDNLGRQEKVVAEILAANGEFSKEKGADSNASQREALFSDLAAAHNAYMELTSNLEEGSKFYNDLTQVLVSFQQKISDFCFARKTEKEEVCKDLQKNIVSEASQPTPLAPPHHNFKPARPPPPKTSEPASAPPPQSWGYPPTAAPSGVPATQPQLPYPTYQPYPYPYPGVQNPYNPYGQIMMPPFPPAPGYQPQPGQQPTAYPTYSHPSANYPYPTQQYRPYQQ